MTFSATSFDVLVVLLLNQEAVNRNSIHRPSASARTEASNNPIYSEIEQCASADLNVVIAEFQNIAPRGTSWLRRLCCGL